MNDLLKILRDKGKKKGFYFNEKELKEENVRVNLELQEFIRKNKQIQDNIKELKTNNIRLRKAKEALVMAVSDSDKKSRNELIRNYIESNTNLQSVIKRTLEDNFNTFIKDIDSNANLFEQEKRISRNLHGSAVKNFQDAMLEFQNLESELKSTNEAMIIRSAEIYSGGKKLTQEEKLNYLSHPEQVQDLIQQSLQGQAPTKLQNALNDIEDRHAEIRKLEKSILEVHKLIEELAGLVKFQGEMVDNICENIASAKEDTLSAEENIIKSKQNMINARRKKCIILIIVVIILLIILLPIILTIF